MIETQSEIPMPLHQRGYSRQDIAYPAWIKVAMASRWVVIALAMTYASLFDQNLWIWFGAIIYFFALPKLCYLFYRREHRERAEVVFYNEKDGYCAGSNEGDDDGDGGD